MQEIIPMLERSWMATAKVGSHEVSVVDVGRQPLSYYLPKLLEADHVVFTCFTVKLARLGEFLRKELHLSARYVVYLHNQATIACWPYFFWGFGDVLREHDVFISSSSYDARTLALTFPKSDVRIHPFALPEVHLKTVSVRKSDSLDFVYSGRLSSQKNIHTLIFAYSLWRKSHPAIRSRLILFGGEDGLGSPNMGIRDHGYERKMKALAKSLALSDVVEFTGQLTREKLHRKLQKPHVFVSASLHSDENFGMSALRSLCMGAPAVLSRWGGHPDFALNFKTRAFLVDVERSSYGPWIDPENFALKMAMAANAIETISRTKIPEVYMIGKANHLTSLVREKFLVKTEKLEKSRLASKVLRLRGQYLKKSPEGTRIFESYSDGNSHKFFQAYGMASKVQQSNSLNDLKILSLVPWSNLRKGRIQIEDPHRGRWSLPLRGHTGPVLLNNHQGKNLRWISRALARKLIRAGVATRGTTFEC
jgi:glycosyltransferase involved in cell wall biosynthesis